MPGFLNSFCKSLSVCTQTLNYLRLSYKPGADYHELKRGWASDILEHVGLQMQVKGAIAEEPSMLFVGNHLSYLDIVLLLKLVPKVSFVAKKEIGDWPIFGAGAKKIDTIFVKRENKENRQAARDAIARGLREGRRVAVFPSGTTCMNESKEWRRGIFEIAQQEQVSVQPFRISYSPLRTAAFIDQDALIPHMARLMRVPDLQARIEFHEPIRVRDAELSRRQWQDWARPLDLPAAPEPVLKPAFSL